MTTNAEKILVKDVLRLFHDRDDMIVGMAAVLLDLYRMQIHVGNRTKPHVIASLQAQLDECEKHPSHLGAGFLRSLIKTIQEEKLDAARLLRDEPTGHA